MGSTATSMSRLVVASPLPAHRRIKRNTLKHKEYMAFMDQTGTSFAYCMCIMTVEEMIAEEIDEPAGTELAGLPLEVELDPKGAYSISGTLPLAPKTSKRDVDLRVASD